MATKHKNILLVAFFSILFLAQQVQADGNQSLTVNSSDVSAPQANTTLYNPVFVRLYALNPNGSADYENPCVWPTTLYGCGNAPPVYTPVGYPLEENGYYYLDTERDYLPDVLAIEMNLAEFRPPEPEAMKAQAVAARTFATYKTNIAGAYIVREDGTSFLGIDNSTDFQVYIPGSKYEEYDGGTSYQEEIESAISNTTGEFLQYQGQPIDAEFSNDIDNPTTPGNWTEYLVSVPEPIVSPPCDLSPPETRGNGWGMSQKGAMRWAKGNQCASGGSEATKWPVKWNYQQILVHYYTGVDFINDANGNKITPDDRWNLLNYTPSNAVANAGETVTLNLTVQNTSTTNWADRPVAMGYKWNNTGNWIDIPNTTQTLAKGDSTTPALSLALSIPVPFELVNGQNTLYLDLRYGNDPNSWFSEQGWFDAEIPVQVNGGATPTPSGAQLSCTTILDGMNCVQVDDYTVRITDMHKMLANTYHSGPITASGEIIAPLNTPIYLTLDGEFRYNNNVNYISNLWDPPFHDLMAIRVGGIDYTPSHYTAYAHAPEPGDIYTYTSTQGIYEQFQAVIQKTTSGNLEVIALASCIADCNYSEFSQPSLVFQLSLIEPIVTPTPTLDPSITATPTQAPTVTPYPTPCPWWTICWFDRDCSGSQVPNEGKVSNLSRGVVFAVRNFDRITNQAALLYRVRDEILDTTEEGQRLIDLYYEHSQEIGLILDAHPDLAEQGLDVIDALTPNLEALLDGQGNTVTISSTQVQQAQDFLNTFSTHASTELQADISAQENITPLDDFVGQTMDEAWETVVESSVIFSDDFESGDLSAWSETDIDNGDLSVSADAAAIGTYGMQAVINDTARLAVDDETPANETHYRARFYFDPNSVTIPAGEGFPIIIGNGTNDYWEFVLYLNQVGSYYNLDLIATDDADNWLESGDPTYITNDWQAVEVEWQASSAPGADDGYINLWVNDILVQNLDNLDTDTQSIDYISLGALDVYTGTSGTIYFDAFESSQGESIGLDPNGPSVSPPPTGIIFSDGFESGDLNTWEWAVTHGGDLSVTTQAAATGSYGLQAYIDNGSERALYDTSPDGQAHFSTRFYLDPNSVSIPAGGNGIYLIDGSYGAGWAFCLALQKQGAGYYSLSLCAMDDSDDWIEKAPETFIVDDWNAVELEWQAASAVGADDGYVKLWVNDTFVDSIENLDNDTQTLTEVSFGVKDSDSGTTGTLFFDAFEARDGGYIGLDPNGPSVSPPPSTPDLIFADDFENGDLSEWSSTTTDGGDLFASNAANYQSSYGLEALIDDTANLRVIDKYPLIETQYHARFYFDPNSLSMDSGKKHYIFDGRDTHMDANIFRTELFYENGDYKLRLRAIKDSWSYLNTGKYVLLDDWNLIEIEWQASSAPGANDGVAKLWINEVLVETISNIDNDTFALYEAHLGATNGVDSSTSGSMYFDHFESRRESYIGP